MRSTLSFCAALMTVAALLTVPTLMLCAPPAAAQGDPQLTIDGKMLISGLTELSGSVTASVRFANDSAHALRLGIYSHFDSNGDQWLGASEVKGFLNAMVNASNGKVIWGFIVESGTNFTPKSEDAISGMTAGLLHTPWDSTDPVIFKLTLEGTGSIDTREIESGEGLLDLVVSALSQTTGYTFEGLCSINLRVTTFAIGSLSTPDLEEGEMTGLRTPFGDVVWYSFEGEVSPTDPILDRIAYRSFSIMDNQQIVFVLLIIGALMILRMPGRNFDKYEKLHPKKFRKHAKPLIVVTVSAVALAALPFVFFLLPYLFSFFFYAGYLFVVVPIFVVTEYFFAKGIYARAAVSIPDESMVEYKQAIIEREGEGEWLCKVCYMPIEATLDIFRHDCGATMHVSCAQKAQTCPQCGAGMFAQQTRSIQCRSCGETFLHSGNEDVFSIQCPKCGAFQEEIAPGKNYLVADDDKRNAFMMIRAVAKSGRPAMALTTMFPGKIRSEYDLKDVTIKWFSDSSTDIDNVNPKDLEGDPMEVLSTFLMTTKESGVLIDGTESLIEINGFEKVLAFIKRVNDLSAIHGATIILSLNKRKVPDQQFKAISDEFDETHDYQ